MPLLPEGAAGSRPRLRAAAMARATQVFPEPGSPERTETSASGEAVFPKPVYGAGLDVCEADQVSLAGGGWGCIA